MQLELWNVRDCDFRKETPPGTEQFTAFDRSLLLLLARRAVWSIVAGHEYSRCENLTQRLQQPGACFVSLFKENALRGCVGNLLARAPLYAMVMENAQGAAMRDSRFSPVSSNEIDALRIEISVLTEPESLAFSSPEELLDQIQPFEHGVLLKADGRVATFLPQVWRQIPEKVAFLDRLVQKAGCAAGIWKSDRASILVYRVECFEEEHGLLRNN